MWHPDNRPFSLRARVVGRRALTGCRLAGLQTRLWEPRRLRLFSTAAQLITTGRRCYLRLARRWPWTDVITDALDRLHTLPNPG